MEKKTGKNATEKPHFLLKNFRFPERKMERKILQKNRKKTVFLGTFLVEKKRAKIVPKKPKQRWFPTVPWETTLKLDFWGRFWGHFWGHFWARFLV
jgi:hypothetical protein